MRANSCVAKFVCVCVLACACIVLVRMWLVDAQVSRHRAFVDFFVLLDLRPSWNRCNDSLPGNISFAMSSSALRAHALNNDFPSCARISHIAGVHAYQGYFGELLMQLGIDPTSSKSWKILALHADCAFSYSFDPPVTHGPSCTCTSQIHLCLTSGAFAETALLQASWSDRISLWQAGAAG